MYLCVCVCVCVCVCGHSNSADLSDNFSHTFVCAYSILALLFPVSYPVEEWPVSRGLTPIRKYSLRDASCALSCHFTPIYKKSRRNVY
jgi:hypothetical protein